MTEEQEPRSAEEATARSSVPSSGPYTVWPGYGDDSSAGEELFVRLIDAQGRRVTLSAGAVARYLNDRGRKPTAFTVENVRQIGERLITWCDDDRAEPVIVGSICADLTRMCVSARVHGFLDAKQAASGEKLEETG